MLEIACDATGMSRPLNRAQALQNQAFLRELRRTGNVRDAARRLGVHRSTFTKRRKAHPAFAAQWDAALVVAHAALHDGTAAVPGEPRVVRSASGRLHLRRAQPRRLTRDAEQAFLSALSATANVRLSAKAAGFSHSAFYARRKVSPAFAREMRMALEEGYDTLQMALLASTLPGSHEDDAWRHNEPPAMPPMTVNQALQLMYLYQKEARLLAEPAHIRRRRGESREAHSFRLGAMYEARLERDRERFDVAEAARRALGEPGLYEAWQATADLAQVKGWSKGDGKMPHEPGRALFGGWRIENIGKGKT